VGVGEGAKSVPKKNGGMANLPSFKNYKGTIIRHCKKEEIVHVLGANVRLTEK
jgi:hypothetical protein